MDKDAVQEKQEHPSSTTEAPSVSNMTSQRSSPIKAIGSWTQTGGYHDKCAFQTCTERAIQLFLTGDLMLPLFAF